MNYVCWCGVRFGPRLDMMLRHRVLAHVLHEA